MLLSRRGDLNTWTLPGGRLDSGERLEDAALREVEEETGVEARIERAVGLYYLAGWQRMNILYAASPTGGSLRDKTRETRANRYFSAGSLPQSVIGAKEALAETRPQPRVITSTRARITAFAPAVRAALAAQSPERASRTEISAVQRACGRRHPGQTAPAAF